MSAEKRGFSRRRVRLTAYVPQEKIERAEQ